MPKYATQDFIHSLNVKFMPRHCP